MARMKQLFVAALLCCIYQCSPIPNFKHQFWRRIVRARAQSGVVNPDL
jgi:hypothetical protein